VETFDQSIHEKHDGCVVVYETVVVTNTLGTQVYNVEYKWVKTEGCNYKIAYIFARTLECVGVDILGSCNP
jgi:hypothetical protein